MPDWTKRVLKERAGDLLPGEQVKAATYFQGRGTASTLVKKGMVGGIARDVADLPLGTAQLFEQRATEGMMERAQAENQDPDGSFAADFPSDRGVIAITDRRLIVFGYKQGMFSTKILDPVKTIDRTKVQAWSLGKAGITTLLSMGFTDGSSIGIEVPKANKPEQFAADAGIPLDD